MFDYANGYVFLNLITECLIINFTIFDKLLNLISSCLQCSHPNMETKLIKDIMYQCQKKFHFKI